MAFGKETLKSQIIKDAPATVRHLRPENLLPLKRELTKQLSSLKLVNSKGYQFKSPAQK